MTDNGGKKRGRTTENGQYTLGGNEMKILTDEAEDKLVSIIGTVIVVSIILLIAGVVGGIEQGLLF